jgi:hypothetical protein
MDKSGYPSHVIFLPFPGYLLEDGQRIWVTLSVKNGLNLNNLFVEKLKT